MHRVRTALACLVFVAAGLPANFSDSKDFRLNSETALVAPISTNYWAQTRLFGSIRQSPRPPASAGDFGNAFQEDRPVSDGWDQHCVLI